MAEKVYSIHDYFDYHKKDNAFADHGIILLIAAIFEKQIWIWSKIKNDIFQTTLLGYEYVENIHLLCTVNFHYDNLFSN